MKKMNHKINILGIDLIMLSAKETMKQVIEYLDTEVTNTIEIITLEMLMKEKDPLDWKEQLQQMDLLIPVETAMFESSESVDKTYLKDVEKKTFLRMLFRYFQRTKKSIFLLAEEEGELSRMRNAVLGYGHGISLVGEAILEKDSGLEENIINTINGIEPDCIISGLTSPYGEEFIVRNRALLNARLWIGGMHYYKEKSCEKLFGKLKDFIMKKIFRYQMEKQKQ